MCLFFFGFHRLAEYDSRESCITHESINRAFSQASGEYRLIESRDGDESEDVADALLETSRILAKEYKPTPPLCVINMLKFSLINQKVQVR